jgi:hypothetical protein
MFRPITADLEWYFHFRTDKFIYRTPENYFPIFSDYHENSYRFILLPSWLGDTSVCGTADPLYSGGMTLIGEKPKDFEKKLSQCHFVHHKSQMYCMKRELQPPRRETALS